METNPDICGFSLKRGTKFLHASWLDGETNQPVLCEVTRVAQGVVYWKHEGQRKARWYFPVEQASKYVGKVISTSPTLG